MLSGKLVHLIEEHWETIASRVIEAIHRHPELPKLAQRPDTELKEWCEQILHNLGYLLSGSREEEVKRRYQVLGRLRFEESLPLHEAVLRFHILKDKIIEFVHEQGFPLTAMELYAEEELERRVCRFFDDLVYHVVVGYENAMKRASKLAV